MASETDHFINDIAFDDALVGAVIRSPVANAEVLSVSCPTVPGDVTLLGASDIPGENIVRVGADAMPLLAHGRVHYRGEALFLAAGPDEIDLAEFIRRIEIRFREDAPETLASPREEQTIAQREIVYGDPETALADSFQVVEGEYSTCDQEHFVSDAHGAIAAPDRRDHLTLFCPTQWPYHVARTVAGALGVPRERISVHVTTMSAHKDSRVWFPSLVAAQAALLARASGRRVKLILPKVDAVSVAPRRPPCRIIVKTGLDKEGAPTAHDIRVEVDGGAYPMLAEELLNRTMLGAVGVYRSDNIRVHGRIVRTSLAPSGPFFGLGLSQGFFASETHASRIAELSQTDPYTWKCANLGLRPEARVAEPAAFAAGRPPETLLSRAAEMSDFRRKHAAYEMLKKRRESIAERSAMLRGIGFSVAYQGSGFHGRGEEVSGHAVVVRMEADGRLIIKTSAVSIDGAARQVWIDTAASTLGIDRRKINLADVDTDETPDSGPSTFSRNVTIVNGLVARACQTIGRRRFRAALPIEVKKSFTLPRVGRWDPRSFTGAPFVSLSWASAVVETEMDPITLETIVRGIWMTVACGRVLNEAVARRTVENGIFHGLWWCSSNHGSLREPKVYDLPPIEIEFVEPVPKAPAGGVEDLAGNVIPSAYVSAVAQATGRYFDTLPVTPELVHRYTEDM